QRGFWMKWRHRDPVGLADEIEWLVRARGGRVVTLADENPTTIRGGWETLLKEVARGKVAGEVFSAIRATDIVRDRASLGLWKEAGMAYVLMGMDGTDEATLKAIRKKSTTRVDYEACRLLRAHGIFSMIGHIVGLAHERAGDFRRAWKQVRLYD